MASIGSARKHGGTWCRRFTNISRAASRAPPGRGRGGHSLPHPEGAPQAFRPPASAVRGNPPEHREYNFDPCSPETLIARATVKGGQIVFPGGTKLSPAGVAGSGNHDARLLRKVKELAQAGATVFGLPPRKSPSLVNYPQCDAEVRQLAGELWSDGVVESWSDGKQNPSPDASALQSSNTPFPHRRLGKGRMFLNRQPNRSPAARRHSQTRSPAQSGFGSTKAIPPPPRQLPGDISAAALFCRTGPASSPRLPASPRTILLNCS